jgi:hypothetical protein
MHIEEIFKPIIRKGTHIPGYLISNKGRVYSEKTNKFLSITDTKNKERGNSSLVGLSITENLFEYSYSNNKLMCQIHQLVAEVFMPIDDFPPVPIDDWLKTPESCKNLIRECILIDHIDNDPYNNCVSNLRYVTARQNNVHFKNKKH